MSASIADRRVHMGIVIYFEGRSPILSETPVRENVLRTALRLGAASESENSSAGNRCQLLSSYLKETLTLAR